jgi:hypothetical protein
MKPNSALTLFTLMTIAFCGAAAQGQRPVVKSMPNMPALPAGFQTPSDAPAQSPWKAAGMGDSVSGEKKNYFPSPCFSVPKKATLTYLWMMGGSQIVIDGELTQPEAPARGMNTGSLHEEPAGRYAHRGGVITFRKFTGFPDIGIDSKGQCNGRTLEYYSVNWIAVVKGKMINININNYVGGKEDAQGVVDGLIGPLSAAM